MPAKQSKPNATHVMSVRLDEETYQRVRAYAIASCQKESVALRELAAKGLACDGLGLYATELGRFMRTVMTSSLEGFDETLERRNDEQEDRIARVVSRAARMGAVASLICVDLAKAVFPTLKDVPPERVWAEYARRAGEMQAGRSYSEAVRHGRDS